MREELSVEPNKKDFFTKDLSLKLHQCRLSGISYGLSILLTLKLYVLERDRINLLLLEF